MNESAAHDTPTYLLLYTSKFPKLKFLSSANIPRVIGFELSIYIIIIGKFPSDYRYRSGVLNILQKNNLYGFGDPG